MLEYTDFMTNLFCRGEIDSACGHIRRRYLNLHRVSNRQPAAAPDIRMGQQAVELEFAVRKVLHAYKALHAVYKLDKNSPGRSAADDTVKGFSQMPAHIFRHIALFRLAFRRWALSSHAEDSTAASLEKS